MNVNILKYNCYTSFLNVLQYNCHIFTKNFLLSTFLTYTEGKNSKTNPLFTLYPS